MNTLNSVSKNSGAKHTLGVPTEPSMYAFSTVITYGAYSVLGLLKVSVPAVILLRGTEKQSHQRLWKFIGWSLLGGSFVLSNYGLWESTAPISTRIYYAAYLLLAASLVTYLCSETKVMNLSPAAQVALAALLFFLVVDGAGYGGDLEAYSAMDSPPAIQFLLAADAISGAHKLGIPFSETEPDLTASLNVVAFSDKMFYVQIPVRLDVSQAQNTVRLDIERRITVAIPRDKVIMASTHR